MCRSFKLIFCTRVCTIESLVLSDLCKSRNPWSNLKLLVPFLRQQGVCKMFLQWWLLTFSDVNTLVQSSLHTDVQNLVPDVVQPGQMSHGTIQVAVTAHYKGALLHKHTSTKHACANTNGQDERVSARTPK